MRRYINREDFPQASVLSIEVEGGHYEEFLHEKSTFIYYVLEGRGSFYLNGEETKARPGDLIIAKPRTKIFYLGKMKLLLFAVPRWEEKYEKHVRDISHQ